MKSLKLICELTRGRKNSVICAFVGDNVARDVARDVARGAENADSLESLIINMIAKDSHVTRTEMAESASSTTA